MITPIESISSPKNTHRNLKLFVLNDFEGDYDKISDNDLKMISEKVTVYATTVKGELCVCEYGGDVILKAGDLISFPKGEFKIIDTFWNDNKNILLFKDFSTFEYGNTH